MDAIDALSAILARREAEEPGQQSKLARHLQVSPALVWQWLNRKRPISAVHVRGIEEYFGGEISRYTLAPEIFGPAPQGTGDQQGRAAA